MQPCIAILEKNGREREREVAIELRSCFTSTKLLALVSVFLLVATFGFQHSLLLSLFLPPRMLQLRFIEFQAIGEKVLQRRRRRRGNNSALPSLLSSILFYSSASQKVIACLKAAIELALQA